MHRPSRRIAACTLGLLLVSLVPAVHATPAVEDFDSLNDEAGAQTDDPSLSYMLVRPLAPYYLTPETMTLPRDDASPMNPGDGNGFGTWWTSQSKGTRTWAVIGAVVIVAIAASAISD